MTTAAYAPTCPVIVGNNSINEPRIELQLLKMYASATRNVAGNGGLEYAPGSWITLHATPANGYVPCESACAAASHVIRQILDQYGNPIPWQYVAATDTTQYYVLAEPIGGLVFDMTEDADTTPIPDASSGNVNPFYADIAVGAMADTTQGAARLTGKVIPNIKIDSHTANASSSGLLIQLMGVSPNPGVRSYSATTLASPRVFRVKVIDSVAQASQ